MLLVVWERPIPPVPCESLSQAYKEKNKQAKVDFIRAY